MAREAIPWPGTVEQHGIEYKLLQRFDELNINLKVHGCKCTY